MKSHYLIQQSRILILLVLFFSVTIEAQVGIGTDNPDASSILDIRSLDKGVLIPRMTSEIRTGIGTPATGLLVYDTTTSSFWFYDGNIWKNLSAGGGGGANPWNIQGTVTQATNNTDDIYSLGSVAIGKSEAISGTSLDIEGSIRGGGAADYATIGDNSIAFGYSNIASGDNAIAFGSQTQSTGDYATAFGGATIASGLASATFGMQTQASGMGAAAFGQNTTASSYMETVFGSHNLSIPGNASTWVATDNLFVVGNGTGSFPNINSNALTIRKDGWMGVGSVSKHSTERLRVAGSIRTSNTTYPDYVFEKYFLDVSDIKPDYTFKSLEEIKDFIEANHHLPGVTSIKDVELTEDGSYEFNITELAIQSLEKIEELFLHTIEQNEKVKTLTQEIEELKSQKNALQREKESLEKQLSDFNRRLERLEKK